MDRVFKALADPTRRRVLELLRRQPMTAGELAGHFVVTRSTMSAHFNILREAGLIEVTRGGRNLTYRLRLSVLEDAMLSFATLLRIDVQPNAPDGRVHDQPTAPPLEES